MNTNGMLRDLRGEELMAKVKERGESLFTEREHGALFYNISVHFEQIIGVIDENTEYWIDIVSEDIDGNQKRLSDYENYSHLKYDQAIAKINEFVEKTCAEKEIEKPAEVERPAKPVNILDAKFEELTSSENGGPFIYSDHYYDENGNYIENTMSYGEYSEVMEEFEKVLTDAIADMSFPEAFEFAQEQINRCSDDVRAFANFDRWEEAADQFYLKEINGEDYYVLSSYADKESIPEILLKKYKDYEYTIPDPQEEYEL